MNRKMWLSIVTAAVACGQKADSGGRAGDGSQGVPSRSSLEVSRDAGPGSGAKADREPTIPPPAPTVKKSAKGDCKTEYAPKPTRDPNPMCKIDGGTFMMGAPASDREAREEERPAHAVSLSPYYLDQFEVTNAQIVHYLNAIRSNECDSWGDADISPGECFSQTGEIRAKDGIYYVTSGTGNHPYGGAGWQGADRYCRWVGKRLPTEAEWEFAARHDPKTTKDRKYPWGDQFEPRRANCEEPLCRDGFEMAAPVGSFDGTVGRLDGASPWGVHDLAGNESEFVADCEHPYVACDGPCRNPKFPVTPDCKSRPMVRTSSWASQGGSLRSTWRLGGSGGGFRCAR